MLTLKTEDWFRTNGFPIAIERREPHEPFEPHAHEFCEIVIVAGDRALRPTRHDSRQPGTGDVLVLGNSETRLYREIEDLRLINILFRPELCDMELLDLSGLPGYKALFSFEPQGRNRNSQERALRLSPKELSIALNYVEILDHELKMQNPGFAFMAYVWFMQLVGYLPRAHSQSRSSDPRARSSVDDAIGHLEQHFDQPVNLDELSRLAHMSKRSFIRAFQAATGSTPIAYLVNLRLARAATMLSRHEENVTSVAYKVGYNDSNYFARRFHAMFGVPPSEYRKRRELV